MSTTLERERYLAIMHDTEREIRTPGDDQPASLRETRELVRTLQARLDAQDALLATMAETLTKLSTVVARSAVLLVQEEIRASGMKPSTFSESMEEIARLAPYMKLGR